MDLRLRSGCLEIPAASLPTPEDSGTLEPPERTAETSPSVSTLGRLAGLDGLRAIAVLAVLLYHSGLEWLPGGFLGVEVFFVISGYLITGLLITEWRARGRINVKAFWVRRARRLLPALFVLLGGTLAVALIWLPGELAQLRVDVLAALAYVTNWYLVLGQQPYFEGLDRQSPLLHLWSLAVEEQFYVVWPVLLAVGLWLIGRRLFFAVTLGGAVISAVWMAGLYQPDADVSRIYYGTDTRLTGLLLGAALAFVWLPRPGHSTWLPNGPRWLPVVRMLLDVVAISGLVAIGWFLFAVDEADAFLFRGGLALLAAATAVTIAAVVHPSGRVGNRILDLRPLRWLGTRSYSVYLWHWPVFMVTRPGLDIPLEPLPALALRLVVTAALAEASYRFVEMRFRSGPAGATDAHRIRRPVRTKLASAAVMAASITFLAGPIATASPPARPAFLATDSVDGLVTGNGADTPNGNDDSSPSQTSNDESESSGTSAARSATSTTTTPEGNDTARTRPPASRILILGDSVVLAAYRSVVQKVGPVTVDAAIGRSVGEGVRALRGRHAANALGDIVIVDLGNNGRLTPDLFDSAMNALASVRLVVWVNLTVPRDWESANNRVIATGIGHYPNTRLVDWHSASTGHPDLFWDDGYHPRGLGAKLYASLIAQAIS